MTFAAWQGSPIQRTSLAHAVRDRLLALLEDRSVHPGDALPSERDLMVALGIGRSSLREALAALEALQVIVSAPGKGYRFRSVCETFSPPAPIMAAQIEELFEARQVLEVGIAELACVRATDEDFAALEECLASIARARKSRRSTAPVAARFHALLARAAHNGLLEGQLLSFYSLMEQVGAQTEARTGSAFAEEQWSAHKLLLDTLRTRDISQMRIAVQEHLRQFAEEGTSL